MYRRIITALIAAVLAAALLLALGPVRVGSDPQANIVAQAE